MVYTYTTIVDDRLTIVENKMLIYAKYCLKIKQQVILPCILTYTQKKLLLGVY